MLIFDSDDFTAELRSMSMLTRHMIGGTSSFGLRTRVAVRQSPTRRYPLAAAIAAA